MDIATAFQLVLDMARSVAASPEQIEACNIIEDVAVNQYGDD